MERPWAHALARLLQERRLKKGELAALCPGSRPGESMRPGNISAILNSPRPPDIRTLQRLIQGFDRWAEMHRTADLPRVKLWEFFVTDEEAQLLREKRKQHDALAAPPPRDDRRELFEQFLAFTEAREAAARPPRPRAVTKKR